MKQFRGNIKSISKVRVYAATFVLILCVLSGISPSLAHAQSNGIGVSPRKDYTISPGSQVNDTLFVDNLSPTLPLKLNIRVVDFKPSGQSGAPALQLATNAPQTPWSLKPYIKVQSSINIDAGKSSYIPFTISIPKNQGAGTFYSAIEYSASDNGGGQVNVGASAASLVFVTVPGHATEIMHLIQFGAFVPTPDDLSGSYSSWYFTSQPKVLAYSLQNQGNVAEQPSGSIIIKNIFGKQVSIIQNANPKSQLALIGQTRRFEACINPVNQQIKNAPTGQTASEVVCANPNLKPGRYSAEAVLLYGLNGNPQQQIVATTTFWYLPLWFVIPVLVILALILFGIYSLVKGVKRKTRKARK